MQKDTIICAPEGGNNCFTEEMGFVLSWSMAPTAEGSAISFFFFFPFSFAAFPAPKGKKIFILNFFYQNSSAGQF